MNDRPPPQILRNPFFQGLRWFVGFWLLAATAMAAPPAWQASLSPAAPGGFPTLEPVALEYRMSWNGILRAGTLTMDFAPAAAKKRGRYVVRSTAKSQGAASALFPYQTTFWSEVVPSTLRPAYFHAVETDAKEKVETTVRYLSTRVDSTEVTRILKTGKVTTETRVFEYAPVFDMFSAMLHVRSQKLAAGDTITQVIQPFNSPYLLRVNVIGREIHNGQKAIKLSVGMQKIDLSTLKLKAYKKLKRDATMWLSDDADRIPLELRAAAFIGEVRATLVARRKP